MMARPRRSGRPTSSTDAKKASMSMCMIEQPDSSDPQSRYAADERGARLMSTRSRRADGEHGPATRPVHSHRPAAEDLLDRVTEVLRGRERTLGAVVGDEVAPPSLDPGPKRCRTGEEDGPGLKLGRDAREHLPHGSSGRTPPGPPANGEHGGRGADRSAGRMDEPVTRLGSELACQQLGVGPRKPVSYTHLRAH